MSETTSDTTGHTDGNTPTQEVTGPSAADDPRDTDHAVGADQAAANAENEPAG